MDSTTNLTRSADVIDVDFPAKPADDERAIYVQGLRDLADFLESHADVPVDDADSLGPFLAYRSDMTPERAVDLADALDGVVVHHGNYVKLCRAFGPITYRIMLSSSDVLEEREQVATVTVLPEALARRERS